MRKAPIYFVALFAVATAVAACGGSDDSTTSEPAAAPATSAAAPAASGDTTAAAGGANCGTTVDEIATAAKAEGQVNLIALPDTWANYKGILDSFKSKYGIKAPVANPDASSADELTAIETLRGQPDMPEVVDVGPSFTSQMVDKGYAETYKPTVWDEIPDNLKDPDGKWVAAYYGVLSIASNTTLVKNPPQTWADLKKPEYKGQVTINGDPREAGAAFAAVMAASLANGGSFDDIMPGIQFFADLKKAGNLQQIDVTEAAVLSGDVPIALDWTYNFPALPDGAPGCRLRDAGRRPVRRRLRRLLRAVRGHRGQAPVRRAAVPRGPGRRRRRPRLPAGRRHPGPVRRARGGRQDHRRPEEEPADGRRDREGHLPDARLRPMRRRRSSPTTGARWWRTPDPCAPARSQGCRSWRSSACSSSIRPPLFCGDR